MTPLFSYLLIRRRAFLRSTVLGSLATSLKRPLSALQGILLMLDGGRPTFAREPRRYVLGFIPPQRVWHFDPLSIRIEPQNLSPNATLSVGASPIPRGVINFDPADGTLSYTPHAADKRDFSLTISAEEGGQKEAQTITVSPMPHLPAEATLLSAEANTGPSEDSPIYLAVSTSRSTEERTFNANSRKTRRIEISGKTVRLDALDDSNGLVKRLVREDNVNELTIYAERVVVRGVLKLPQTRLTVYARTLEFDDAGVNIGASQIDTTPKSDWPEALAATANVPAANGKRGCDAGSITLYIREFRADGPGLRFVARGGNGQKGGRGMRGPDGKSMPVLGAGVIGFWANRFPNTVYATYHDGSVLGGNQKEWPEDGRPGVPAGVPGNGGDGGDVSSTLADVKRYVGDLSPGKPAEKGEDQPGGNPGQPVEARWLYSRLQDFNTIFYEEATHQSQGGSLTRSPGPDPATTGKPGEFKHLSGTSVVWLHPHALSAVVAHAKDLYLAGALDAVRDVLSPYRLVLSSGEGRRSAQADPRLEKLRLEIEEILHRLSSNLDYFGNPAGWAPMLSLEANLVVFQSEIDQAIRTLFLTYWIKGRATEDLDAQQGLATVLEQLHKDTSAAQKEFAATQQLIGPLEVSAQSISQRVDVLLQELQDLEKELMRRARDNVAEQRRAPFWEEACRTLGAVCQVLPVFQPALAGVGVGLSLIADSGKNGTWDTIKQIPNVAKAFNTEKIKESRANLEQQINLIDPAKATDAAQYLDNLLKLGGQFSQTLSTLQQLNSQTQISKDEVDAELRRIEAEDPQFRQYVERINALNVQKEQFAQQLARTAETLAALTSRIATNLTAVDVAARQLDARASLVQQDLLRAIDSIERRTYDRLLRYHYTVARAYEYRLLLRYRENLRLEPLIQQLTTLLPQSTDGRLTAGQFNQLQAIYQNLLSDIAFTLYTRFNDQPKKGRKTITVSLSDEQVAELNKTGRLRINLVEAPGFLQLGEEDQRIVNLAANDVDARITKQPIVRTANLSLTFSHSGMSRILSESKVYQFRHGAADGSVTAYVWETDIDLIDGGSPKQVEPSASDTSLLAWLLQQRSLPRDNLALYTNPGAWTDILIQKAINAPGGAITVDGLRLTVTYDFSWAPPNQVILVVDTYDGLTPLLTCTPDLNKRADGRGTFTRVYGAGTAVVLFAPGIFGERKFSRWIDLDAAGQLISDAATVQLILNESRRIGVVYA